MANETAAAKAAEQETSRERGARQELVGIVTSAKMEKTIVVKVRAHDAASALSARDPIGEEILRARRNAAKRAWATRCASYRRGRFRN